MAWIHDLSPWLVGPLITAAFVVAAVVGLLVTRRWSRSRGLHALVDNGVIGWIVSAILTIYAISIGLIAVATWTGVTEAQTVATLESAHAAALYRDFDGYPEPLRGELEQALVDYLRYVVDEDWPAQRRGIVPHHGTHMLTVIERTLYGFEPHSVRQRLLHAEALHAFNALVLSRRERLDAVDSAVPLRLWVVVLVGAAVSIGATFVFSMESFALHALMTGLLATMISLLVFFIAISDPPFRGSSGVSSESYELVVQDLLHQHRSPS